MVIDMNTKIDKLSLNSIWKQGNSSKSDGMEMYNLKNKRETINKMILSRPCVLLYIYIYIYIYDVHM